MSWARLRNECPVARTEKHGGFFVLSRYADVFAAALDTDTFSSDGDGLGVAIPPQDVRPFYPIDLDPPYLRGTGKMLNLQFFNMRTVATMENSIRELARELIAAFPESGVFDVAAAFTLPLPRRVGFRMLSFPEDRTAEISELVEAVMSNVAERQGAAAPRLFEDARRDPRGTPLPAPSRWTCSTPWCSAKWTGCPLTRSRRLRDAHPAAHGRAFHHERRSWDDDRVAGRSPRGTVRRLREHPELHNLAVDEFVRYSSPVAHIGRTVMTDTEVEGCPLPKGSRVLLGFGSANRDERTFQRADEVLIGSKQPKQARGLRDRPAPLYRVARGQAADQGRPAGASRCHAPLPGP